METQRAIILHTTATRERGFLRGRQCSGPVWTNTPHAARLRSPHTLRRAVAADPLRALRDEVGQHWFSRLAKAGMKDTGRNLTCQGCSEEQSAVPTRSPCSCGPRACRPAPAYPQLHSPQPAACQHRGPQEAPRGGRWRLRGGGAALTWRGPTSSTFAFSMAGTGRRLPPVRCPATRPARGMGAGNGGRRTAIGVAVVTCRGRSACGPGDGGGGPPAWRQLVVRRGWRAGSCRPRQPLVRRLLTGSKARGAGDGRGLSGILVVGLPRAAPRGPAEWQRRVQALCAPRAPARCPPWGFVNPNQCALKGPPALVPVGRDWQQILLPALFGGEASPWLFRPSASESQANRHRTRLKIAQWSCRGLGFLSSLRRAALAWSFIAIVTAGSPWMDREGSSWSFLLRLVKGSKRLFQIAASKKKHLADRCAASELFSAQVQ